MAKEQDQMKFGVTGFDRCSKLLWAAGLLATLGFCILASTPLHAEDAVSLRARHVELRAQLANNQFQRPLYLVSSEDSGNLKGDVYALIDRPFAVVGPALQGMDHWCDILILHLNVKSCRFSTPKAGDTLSLSFGRKFDQSLTDGYQFDFLYTVMMARPDYLQVVLNAEQGPLGTSRYRIMLEAVSLNARQSFLHLSYSYASGMAARAATRTYLATIGRNKVGFSIIEHKPNGQPVYMGGMRGVIERNTMRYYLAIEAYLGALSVPASERLEKRLNDWFAGTERYPLQLHELERDEYLNMKRKEVRRQ
jgi:hypothetical protein